MWEVFVRARRGLSHVHVGSLHAPDAETALQNARDVYTRRGEGVSIWVVRISEIPASDPDDLPTTSMPTRSPTATPPPTRSPTKWGTCDRVDRLRVGRRSRCASTSTTCCSARRRQPGPRPAARGVDLPAPELEEDIALGQHRPRPPRRGPGALTHAAELEGAGRDEDDFAMGRPEREFTNLLLVEQPNGDFAHTMARQFFFDAYQVELWAGLTARPTRPWPGSPAKRSRRPRYHFRPLSTGWSGSATAPTRATAGCRRRVDDLWRFTGEMFEGDDVGL